MGVINHTTMRKDNQLLVIAHLSQLLNYIVGFGGLIYLLILLLTYRHKILTMNE